MGYRKLVATTRPIEYIIKDFMNWSRDQEVRAGFWNNKGRLHQYRVDLLDYMSVKLFDGECSEERGSSPKFWETPFGLTQYEH